VAELGSVAKAATLKPAKAPKAAVRKIMIADRIPSLFEAVVSLRLTLGSSLRQSRALFLQPQPIHFDRLKRPAFRLKRFGTPHIIPGIGAIIGVRQGVFNRFDLAGENRHLGFALL
jgi:hypothetical protein